MSKTMVETYQELTKDDYNAWKVNNKDKIKKTGVGGVESAYDERENRAMYDAYVAEINAKNAFGRTQSALEQNKSLALDANEQNRANTMRENAVMTERAKEYAERRAIMNGTASAGVSQTAMIDLMAQMANARADAQASYDNQERTIVQDYLDALNDAQVSRDNVIMTAQGNANAVASDMAVKRAERSETKREGKVTDVENALADYDVGNITFEELKNVYENSQDVLDSEENKGIINEYLEILDSQEKESSFFGNETSAGTGDNVGELSADNKGLIADDLKVTDISASIGPKEISLDSINALLDVDGAGDGDEQDAWVNEVITEIKNGQIKDGTIIDMNYGSIGGQNKGNYFVYKNGKLYQSDWTYDELDELLKESVQSISDKIKKKRAGRNSIVVTDEEFAMWENTNASGNGEFKIKVNGKEVTFLRKDD